MKEQKDFTCDSPNIKSCSQTEENTHIISPVFERKKSNMMEQNTEKYLKVISDLKQKMSILEQSNTNLLKELKESQRSNFILNEELRKCQKSNLSIIEELQACQTANIILRDELNIVEKSNSVLTEESDELKEKVSHLRGDLKELKLLYLRKDRYDDNNNQRKSYNSQEDTRVDDDSYISHQPQKNFNYISKDTEGQCRSYLQQSSRQAEFQNRLYMTRKAALVRNEPRELYNRYLFTTNAYQQSHCCNCAIGDIKAPPTETQTEIQSDRHNTHSQDRDVPKITFNNSALLESPGSSDSGISMGLGSIIEEQIELDVPLDSASRHDFKEISGKEVKDDNKLVSEGDLI